MFDKTEYEVQLDDTMLKFDLKQNLGDDFFWHSLRCEMFERADATHSVTWTINTVSPSEIDNFIKILKKLKINLEKDIKNLKDEKKFK